MYKRLLILILIVLSYSTYSYAESGHFSVRGIGAATCDMYLSKLNDNNANFWKFSFVAWVQGYLSAVNISGKALADLTFFVVPGPDRIIAYLSNYCYGHPEGYVAGSLSDFSFQLRKQQLFNN